MRGFRTPGPREANAGFSAGGPARSVIRWVIPPGLPVVFAWSFGLLGPAPRRNRVREETEVHNVATGTIKKVISERGFGFIAAPDGKEYFFHKDGLSSSLDFDRLTGGESVSFDVEAGPKGDRAVRVQSA